jgi:hypothetical protein
MTATEHAQLLADAYRLPEGVHRSKILEQLKPLDPSVSEGTQPNEPSYELRPGPGSVGHGTSGGVGTHSASGSPLTIESLATIANASAPEPVVPKLPSEQECVERLVVGDPEVIDLMVNTYGWERFAITRKLVVLMPRESERFFVIPVERGFVMGAFDETLATILFDHVPGQLRYVCERPCMVDRTGFAVERLKDADYWRTRELTRGTLV